MSKDTIRGYINVYPWGIRGFYDTLEEADKDDLLSQLADRVCCAYFIGSAKGGFDATPMEDFR